MKDTVRAHIDSAARHLGLAPEIVAKIKQADAEHVFELALKNGKKFTAYRIQHNNKRGPYKGGIRFHANVSRDEVHTLATLMSLKTAAINIPLGGGKGGISVNPRSLSQDEIEEISRAYVRHLHPHLGPNKDIPAPDVNTNSQIIDWMVEEYETITSDQSKASFTGKSIARGGSLGREEATGRGGVVALKKLLELRGQTPSITFAVQGFGNVGSYFATQAKLLSTNWKLVATSDSEAAVFSPNGLDPDALQSYKANRGRFKVYKNPGAKIISNNDLLSLNVDVLVLAGLENTVTKHNAKDIKASYLVEMANGPITRAANDYLIQTGRIILPDIIANSGGVLVSYFEWLQNQSQQKWSRQKVNNKLKKYMEAAVQEMFDYSQTNQLSLNEAAFAIAVTRLVN